MGKIHHLYRCVPLAATLAVAALGCDHSRPAGMTARNWDGLQRIAAEDLRCSRGNLEHSFGGASRRAQSAFHMMRGCGRVGHYVLTCGGYSCHIFPDVHRVAARELECPQRDLRVRAVSHRVRDVTGCGRSASYNLGRGRVWVRDQTR